MTPQDDGLSLRLGVAALAGWVALAIAAGGLDDGRLPAGRGASGLTWALVLGWLLAAWAVYRSRSDGWGRPAVLGVASFAGLVAWSAASIAWASAPDLAWLATNRLALSLAALVLGVAIGRRLGDPAAALAIGMCAACAPVLVWALGSRVLPDLLAPIDDTARLASPIGHANGLALVAVLGVPGALVLTAWRRWRPVAAVSLMAAFTVIALSGSRSGLIALVAAVALGLWLLPDRPGMLATLGAAVAGAVPPAVFGLTAGPLTAEPFLPDPAERRGAGLLLGALLVAGAAIAVVVRELLVPAARRAAAWMEHRYAGRLLLAAAAALVIAGGAVAALRGRDASSGAGRTLSLDSNHRLEWWRQAARGFADAPLAGHGAGSFPLTNLAERTDALDALRVRQPHQLVLELLTESGLVGLALAALTLGAVVWAARRAGRVAAPALCMVVAFLIQAQLDIPWSIPAAAVPVMAAGGVILAQGAGAPARSRAGIPRAGVAGLIAVCAVASAVAGAVARDRASDAYLALGLDPARAVRKADSAASLNPLAIGALLVEAKGRAALTDSAGAARAAREATERQPENPFAWECLAAVSTGAEREEALRRLGPLDPRRDPDERPECRAAG